MKKLVSLLLAVFAICTLAMVSGCGGQKLDGKWIGLRDNKVVLMPIAPVIEIQKAKGGSDTAYTVTMNVEYYDGQGKAFKWVSEKGQPLPATYDKKEDTLTITAKGMGTLVFQYKDGKWTTGSIGLFDGPFVFEPYSSGLDKAQKACQEVIKKQYGDGVTFEKPAGK